MPGKVVKYVLPSKWFTSREGAEEMHIDQLTNILAFSKTPMLIIQLMQCRYCIAAHFSLWATLFTATILYVMQGWLGLVYVPLVWAAGAAIALTVYNIIFKDEE